LAANDSKHIMFMFNCASGADGWSDLLGEKRQLWGFPAALADRRQNVLEYIVVPAWLRFAQITTIGRPDGIIDKTLLEIRDIFRSAGIPSVCSTDIDGWLKTHAAYMAPIMTMGYLPT
jgi:2-dehydropantoate 2-reductase